MKFFKWLDNLLFKDCHRTDCRVCGKQLSSPGGFGHVFIGSGFCDSCMTLILRK